MDRWIGVIGIIVIVGLAYCLSWDRKQIHWRTVGRGLLLQWGIGFVLLQWPWGNMAMQWVAATLSAFLHVAYDGSYFLFGNIVDPNHRATFGLPFAFIVLPTIIFFSAFMALLYYLGIMQWIVKGFAWVMQRVMGTSGAESLTCSANIFLGQVEAPLLIRPYLPTLTASELCAIMVGGFGTIAGGVMAGYIQMGISAQHLIVASCMAVPASLMIAKMLYPERRQPVTASHLNLPPLDLGRNGFDAIARGTADGLSVALHVAAMLITFLALIACADRLLAMTDRWIDGTLLGGLIQPNAEFAGIVPGSLKTLFGRLLSPLVWVLGIPRADLQTVASLLGLKLAANEFLAYSQLAPLIGSHAISPKGAAMATYLLCGFANFASIGCQIGGIGALAPERRADIARLAFRAMLGGALVSCLTATIAGLLL